VNNDQADIQADGRGDPEGRARHGGGNGGFVPHNWLPRSRLSTATFVELTAFRAKAVELGFASLATAALIGWEWLQREEDIFDTFTVAHYRPKERPNAVRVLHEKTREENWVPLFDEAGAPLYPELMAELDALKVDRVGLMLLRPDGRPWPTGEGSKRPGDLGTLRHKVKEIIRAAGLRDELSFTSFRHGGFTEAADADLSDAEIRAQGRHKSSRVLPRYAKRTMRQVVAGAKKRRLRERMADKCQNDQQPTCQNSEGEMPQAIENIGAGEGNRTLVISLEGCCSTIELHPRLRQGTEVRYQNASARPDL
jgi:hypothetical protein